MTITIELKPEIESIIRQRALAKGCDVVDYVGQLIERDAKQEKSFDETLAPIRKGFAESKMTEDELDTLVESERLAMWEEKHGKRS